MLTRTQNYRIDNGKKNNHNELWLFNLVWVNLCLSFHHFHRRNIFISVLQEIFNFWELIDFKLNYHQNLKYFQMRTQNFTEIEKHFLQNYYIVQAYTSFFIYSTAMTLVTLISGHKYYFTKFKNRWLYFHIAPLISFNFILSDSFFVHSSWNSCTAL